MVRCSSSVNRVNRPAAVSSHGACACDGAYPHQASARDRVDTPFSARSNMPLRKIPVVPEIVRDPPHIGILLEMLCFFDRGRTRRKTQHDVPPAAAAGLRNQFNLSPAVRIFPCDVITFYKINTPLRIQPENTLIICPCRRMILTRAVHIRIPLADRVRIRRLVT